MSLSKHRIVQTEDGSITLFSEEYQEACHSMVGAVKETNFQYIQGCRILERMCDYPTFHVLEVGFGTGLGWQLTRDLFLGKKSHLNFVSLEKDPELIDFFSHQQHTPLTHLSEDINILTFQQGNTSLTILVGDARETLKKYFLHDSNRFHAIYQDAFSPKKNPSLWTVEWFQLLKDLCHPDVILSTYSASQSIQKSLLTAGFAIKNGPALGQKKSSTRANLKGDSSPELIQRLSRSPIQPLFDKDLI